MKILNLYAGIGGNRKLWPDDVEVTAVERDSKLAEIYQGLYPNDRVLVCDAHDYLLTDQQFYDFIWSSPPCQSHSRMIRSCKNRKPRYPDLRLYEEILLLQNDFEGKWVVENVVPYYEPLITYEKRGRHVFWSNFYIPEFIPPEQPKDFINKTNVAGSEALKEWLGIHYEGNIYYEGNHCPAQILRNAVHPEIGKIIYEAAMLDASDRVWR